MTKNNQTQLPAEEQRTEQMDASALALKLKTEGEATQRFENSDHANQGLNSMPFADQPPSGALDAEGHRPVLERSRKVR